MYEKILGVLKEKENDGYIPGDYCKSISSVYFSGEGFDILRSILKKNPNDADVKEYYKQKEEDFAQIHKAIEESNDIALLETMALVLTEHADFREFLLSSDDGDPSERTKLSDRPEYTVLEWLTFNEKMNALLDKGVTAAFPKDTFGHCMTDLEKRTKESLSMEDYEKTARSLFFNAMLSVFEKSKQVYSVDATIADAFYQMKEVLFDVTKLQEKLESNAIPQTFAIDLTGYEGTKYHTAFVRLMPMEDYKSERIDGVMVATVLVSDTRKTKMAIETITAVEDENGILQPVSIKKEKYAKPEELDKYSNTIVHSNDNLFFVDALLSYMLSKEPDAKESDFSKQYHKELSDSSRVKNKPTEIKNIEVGYKVGSTLRLNIKNQKEALRKQAEREGWVLAYKRKSPIPHMRAAHYQTYHTGPGRIYTEVKWIEPTLVGFSVGEKEFLVPEKLTVHNVKETEYEEQEKER